MKNVMSVDRTKAEKDAMEAVGLLKSPALTKVTDLIEHMSDEALLDCTKPRGIEKISMAQGRYDAYKEVLTLLKGNYVSARTRETDKEKRMPQESNLL